jgi:hypothetical protein
MANVKTSGVHPMIHCFENLSPTDNCTGSRNCNKPVCSGPLHGVARRGQDVSEERTRLAMLVEEDTRFSLCLKRHTHNKAVVVQHLDYQPKFLVLSLPSALYLPWLKLSSPKPFLYFTAPVPPALRFFSASVSSIPVLCN